MSQLERFLLFGAFVLHFLAAFVWPSWRVWRATGRSPLVLSRADDVFGFVGRWFKSVLALLFAYLAAQAFAPEATAGLGAVAWLDREVFRALGWLLLAASTLWLLVAQRQMGKCWRIGIDTRSTTGLVTHGLFRLSRNPIFLALRVNLVALVLVQPNAFTLAMLTAGEILMQVQVRLEEAHLAARHGSRYAEYRARVRRWL
ncbi:MAG TPA: isoprenylcysteine carboxylmethyltransferase family protein [Burkholderiales bacterium]